MILEPGFRPWLAEPRRLTAKESELGPPLQPV